MYRIVWVLHQTLKKQGIKFQLNTKVMSGEAAILSVEWSSVARSLSSPPSGYVLSPLEWTHAGFDRCAATKQADGTVSVEVENKKGKTSTMDADVVLVCVGRRPVRYHRTTQLYRRNLFCTELCGLSCTR